MSGLTLIGSPYCLNPHVGGCLSKTARNLFLKMILSTHADLSKTSLFLLEIAFENAKVKSTGGSIRHGGQSERNVIGTTLVHRRNFDNEVEIVLNITMGDNINKTQEIFLTESRCGQVMSVHLDFTVVQPAETVPLSLLCTVLIKMPKTTAVNRQQLKVQYCKFK